MPIEQREILRLRAELSAVRRALCTALAWMSQSANSPLRQAEAIRLIEIAEQGGEETPDA